MKTPYKYNKKKEVWQLISLCEFCEIKKDCDFETKDLTGCTEFRPTEEVGDPRPSTPAPPHQPMSSARYAVPPSAKPSARRFYKC